VLGYLVKRFLWMLPVLLGITVLTFFLSRVGGDPVTAYVSEQTPPEAVEQVIARYHLRDPLYIQYWWYLKGLLKGDWGISRAAGNLPVLEAIKIYFSATVELASLSMIIAVAVSLPLGVLSAIQRNGFIDAITRVFSLCGVSIPIFWLALLLQYLFYFKLETLGLPHLPLGGRLSLPVTSSFHSVTGFYLLDAVLQHNWMALSNAFAHLILPAGTLAFASLGLLTRVTRSSLLEVLEEDYVKVARAKGVSERRVIWRHALRNALLPVITVAGLRMGAVLSGAVLVETIFFFPGIGAWAVHAVTALDSASIMAFVLLVALIRSALNLLTDISYVFLDPRVRLE